MAGARAARRAVDAFVTEHPERHVLRGGLDGPHEPLGLDVARRQRPRRAPGHLRRAGRGLRGAGARPRRRRRRPAAARDGLRHAERQGRAVRDRPAAGPRARKRLPVMVSVTIVDQSGRTLSGQTPEAFWNSIAHADLFSVGINCALGAKQMRPFVEELTRVAPVSFSCYPNAGPAQRVRRLRRDARAAWRPTCTSSRRTAGSTSWAAAAARPPSTSGHRGGGARPEAARAPAPRALHAPVGPGAARASGPTPTS